MSKIGTFFDKAIHLISVPKCVGCNTPLGFPSHALCPDCLSKYENTKDRNCPICTRKLRECDCSTKFLASHCLKRLVKVFRYEVKDENVAANNLIYSLKKDNRKDVLSFLATELASALSYSIKEPKRYIFTNVPRRRSAITEYGIDHSAALAKALAKYFSTEYMSLLKSSAKHPQKEMLGKERMENAVVTSRYDVDLTDKRIILVDDIVTTGASMATSAMTLRGMGAKEIVGAALAIAYKFD